MSLWFQSFPTPFDINEMALNARNLIPESYESGPRRPTGRILEPRPLTSYRHQFFLDRPGSSCSIGSSSSETTLLPPIHNKNYQESRYKTELCRHWQESGTCPHGLQCLFAHGLNELKPFRGRHRKYKTQLCKAFHAEGFCSFGPRCSYVHSGVDIIPRAIVPYHYGVPQSSQYQRKLSTDSVDSTLATTEQLQERFRMMSVASPEPQTSTAPVANSPSNYRLSVFAKICRN